MNILRVIVDELPKGCYYCDYCKKISSPGSILVSYYCTLMKDDSNAWDIDDKPDWCPLIKGICEKCWGTGTVLLSIGAKPVKCPDCGGHKVDHRKCIQYESESE